MTSGSLPTYVARETTPIYEVPEVDPNRIAEGGTARLLKGETFHGLPDQHGMVHITDGIGFVPGIATASPCYIYQATANTPILQDHRLDAPQAIERDGTPARLYSGEPFNATPDVLGFLWIYRGIGFVPARDAEFVGNAPATYPNGRRVHVVQDGDNLSNISARYYGTPDLWQKIYQANPEIGADPNVLQDGLVLVIP